MSEAEKQPYLAYALVALLGAGGGTGANQFLGGEHSHPDAVTKADLQALGEAHKRDTREVYYEVKLDMVKADIRALTLEGVDEASHAFRLKAEEEIYLQKKLQDLKR